MVTFRQNTLKPLGATAAVLNIVSAFLVGRRQHKDNYSTLWTGEPVGECGTKEDEGAVALHSVKTLPGCLCLVNGNLTVGGGGS